MCHGVWTVLALPVLLKQLSCFVEPRNSVNCDVTFVGPRTRPHMLAFRHVNYTLPLVRYKVSLAFTFKYQLLCETCQATKAATQASHHASFPATTRPRK